MAITRFRNKHYFLSSMYPHKITSNEIEYPSLENAYQAEKTLDMEDRYKIAKMKDPRDAKRYGQTVKLRHEWNDIKLDIMYYLVKIKFSDPKLKRELIDTEPHELIEENNWGDTFWGTCGGKGQNNLGKILMRVREEVLHETNSS